MPTFLVTFDTDMAYQPQHPRVTPRRRRTLTVHAPTPQAALVHALRVTEGEGQVVSVVDTTEAPHAPA